MLLSPDGGNNRADGVSREAHPLFQVEGSGAIPTSALQLHIESMALDRAKEFNRIWHSILPRFGTGVAPRFDFQCFAATYNGIVFAIGIWGPPVSRSLPQKTWLELKRMAIAPDAPKFTASRMLRIMRNLLHRKNSEVVRVCSYQSKSVHLGTIYAADGWKPCAECKGISWNVKSRPRLESQQIDDRIRWERPIVGPPESGEVNHAA